MTLLLRLIHILAGVFWVGAIFLIAGFLLPTARAMGREGGRFMQHLMLQRRLPVFSASPRCSPCSRASPSMAGSSP
jgi:uncharacterized membrane protein